MFIFNTLYCSRVTPGLGEFRLFPTDGKGVGLAIIVLL
jgi:hypothetical protein